MTMNVKPGVAVGAVLLVGLGGGAAALARNGGANGSRPLDRNEVLEEAASRLGVEPAELRRALREAFEHELDEAVAEGRLTRAQAERLEERANALGRRPRFAVPHHRHGGLRLVDTAASYLETTVGELREAVRSGKTLAEIAAADGKSVDGLRATLVEAAREKLQDRVDAGLLPQARADEILSRVSERIDDVVEGRLPGRHPAWR